MIWSKTGARLGLKTLAGLVTVPVVGVLTGVTFSLPVQGNLLAQLLGWLAGALVMFFITLSAERPLTIWGWGLAAAGLNLLAHPLLSSLLTEPESAGGSALSGLWGPIGYAAGLLLLIPGISLVLRAVRGKIQDESEVPMDI